MECARVSHSVRAATSEDGLILLDVAAGVLFAANPVGARIWQLLEQRCSCEEIVRQLTLDYEVTHERAHTDVAAFVDALRSRGLVTGEGR
jgi:hypothetical protein